MKFAKLSVWNNKWNDVYDFTVKGNLKNYSVFTDALPSFVTTLEQMITIFEKYEKVKKVKPESLKGK